MNFTFANLLGSPYRGGALVLHGDTLLCPAGNRVREVHLREATSATLPVQSPHQVQAVALSPDGALLLSVDTSGRAMLVLRHTRVLLHRWTLKEPCRCARFSPDGRFIAMAVGRVLWVRRHRMQVWHTPARAKRVAPMELHRKYGGCFDTIADVCWSEDSQWLAVASEDITARVFSLHSIPGFTPPTLTGHRSALVATFFASAATRRAAMLAGEQQPALYTVSADGALHAYAFTPAADASAVAAAAARDDSDADSDGGEPDTKRARPEECGAFAHGTWALVGKHYFSQDNTRLTAADYHAASGLLVTAFSNGTFLLHALPAFEHLQTLSISSDRISSVRFNARGDWIALGCAALGQLLVWEWRSETYVLKQQGHFFDVAALAFSPDGTQLASGADDARVKVWAVASGTCFVTFAEHRAAVTGVAFTPSGNAVLSASLDGTVRAFDLVRYRNFRTMTTPEPAQLACVALERDGEVVVAGSRDTQQVFLWNLRNGQLLDVLSGHEGPVSGIAFNPSNETVATAAWDKTVRIWTAFSGGKTATDVLQHSHEVLALAYHPSGRSLACSTLNGEIHFWDAQEATTLGTIEARRDIRGGRLATDRRAAGNSAAGAAFTSLAYSADGAFLFAAGTSKWVCVYDTEERVLLRRFQLSKNLSLDGVLDQLNSKRVTDAGPLELLDTADNEPDEETQRVLPPGAAGGAAGVERLPGTTGGQKRAVLRCRGLALSPSGHTWAAATTEGILLYSLAAAARFDPTDLAEDVSVPSLHRLLGTGRPLQALLVATRLNDPALISHCLLSVPADQVAAVAAQLPGAAVVPVLRVAADAVAGSPHVAFALRWARALLERHGGVLRAAPRTEVAPAMRALQHGMRGSVDRLAPSVEQCLYKLSYLGVLATQQKAAGDEA